jgi:NADH:ubiquinone oxidoreductase subunit H
VIDFLSAHAEIIITLIKIALLLFIVLTVNAYLTWFERKVVAHMQSRWGGRRKIFAKRRSHAGGR